MIGSPAESIVLAATSARSLTELARCSGFMPIALDVFGDRDTRALASEWYSVGAPSGLAFEPARLLAALAQMAQRADVAGWVAGSGFEAQLGLLSAAAECLPLLGNTPATMECVRTPSTFYPLLAELDIEHPETSFERPGQGDGWLLKDAHACGGWHVRPVGRALPRGLAGGRYYQRVVAGTPMSVLFLADRKQARIVGFARQIVKAIRRRPYVFHGGVGGVDPPGQCHAALVSAIDRLVAALGLVGLNGIDFILAADGSPSMLELNPRPTAGINLFPCAVSGGLMRAHVDACRTGVLPEGPALALPVHAFETIFAPAAGRISPRLAEWMAAIGWCRDLPMAGTQYAAADPVCTVHIEAESVDVAMAGLAGRRAAVLEQLSYGEG